MDKVGDDQKVPGKAHPDDRIELEFEPIAVRLGGFLILQAQREKPGIEPGRGGAAQRRLLVEAIRACEGRQDRLARLRDEGAPPGDHQRVVAGLGQIGKDLPHLCRRTEAVGARQPLAVRIRHDLALRDAEQRVMRLVKVPVGEIDIVGCDQWHAVTVCQVDQTPLGPGLVVGAMACKLDIEPVRECRRELA